MPFDTFFKTVGKLASSCAPRAKGIDRLLSSTTGQVWERMTLVHLKQRIPPYASLFQSKQRKTPKNLGPLQIGSEFQQYETHNYVLNLGFHSYEISWVQTIRKFREIVTEIYLLWHTMRSCFSLLFFTKCCLPKWMEHFCARSFQSQRFEIAPVQSFSIEVMSSKESAKKFSRVLESIQTKYEKDQKQKA